LSASTLAAVSSLWTPDGEHRVDRPGPTPPPSEQPQEEEQLSPEEAARLRELTSEIVSTPVEDVVANHCYGLFELAALHLSQQPANLPAARTAIDAMGYLVDGLGERLGQHTSTLTEGLSQLRLAFVAIATTAAGPEAGAEPPDEGAGGSPSTSPPAEEEEDPHRQ
jgi:hypothetical protein